MGFNDLMKNKNNTLAKLQQSVAESKGSGAKDPRVWKLAVDDQFNGSALLRLLPWGDGNRTPWVEWAEVSFSGKGGRYWNRSLKTLGKPDPIHELASCWWERAKAAGEDLKSPASPCAKEAKKFGTGTKYVCNVFVLEDTRNPSTVGKNMLYKYSPSIHKKIQEALTPLYQDVKPIQVFDLIDGANLRVRSKGKKYGDKLNYDYSDTAFEAVAPLHNDMTVLEKIYNGMIDLTEFEAETNYKSYEDLEKEMVKALGQQYVADARGEQFSPAIAAEAGANPFESKVAQHAGQQQQQQADPFAAAGGTQQPQQQQQQQQADPFAAANNATATDPFATASQGGNADPFATAGTVDTPAQTVVDAGMQQSADPFAANAGNVDPFASTGAADVPTQQEPAQQQQQSADPFAGIKM